MKNLLILFTFLFGLSLNDFYAQTEKITIAESATELAKSKDNGSYRFTLHSEVTKEDVKKSAAYYPTFFTLDYDEASHIASIKIINNNEDSRRVLLRFLSSIRSQKIQVDGKNMLIYEFYDLYLK